MTTIAVAGKGGSGKTTIAALLIELLSGKGAVLAVDADPSTNLHLALGLRLEGTVGGVREQMASAVKDGSFDASMPKPDYLEMRVQQALVEGDSIDLLAMGRPEGPGCYCGANNSLRLAVDRLARNYDYVVIDSEAGMEHISRRTTGDVDILLIISEPTLKGMVTAVGIKSLIREMRSGVGRICLVVNRLEDGLPPRIEERIKESSLDLLAAIPEDEEIRDLEENGTPVSELSDNSPLKKGVLEIASKLGLV
ncbi:AAA family ATPase [Chloroflexota bacterium]